ncbi:precorrin-6A synthase (deacetylating) [Pseudomonas sp. Marseille-QA0332]
MRRILLIGIGPGDPRQVTYEAVEAMTQASVFFLLDKGPARRELVDARKAIVERYVPLGDYRLVQVQDPQRIRHGADYVGQVQAWHRQRARLYGRLLQDELGPADTGAFLLWGEPGLYDSALRVLEQVRALGIDFQLTVVPGISSMQALAARHQVPLNRVGEPLTILPGRQLHAQERIDNVMVLLDGHCAFAQLEDPGLWIYWGAYLGSADELLVRGPLLQVRDRIMALRERGRREKGWIMDTYLLRRGK